MKMFCLVVAMLISMHVISAEANAISDADVVVAEYIQWENSGNYLDIYSLFSDNLKANLKRDFSITDSAGYGELRKSSEAKWHDIIEVKRSFNEDNILISLNAIIEENGEAESVSVLLELVFEKDQWKINSISY